MDFRFSRSLRIISVIVLAVFLWDFCLFESAFALTNSSKSQAASSKSTKQETETQKPEEKFQKALEGIETILSDTATDTDTKKSKLKAKKSEIEGYDTDIRKQFADTEKFLKEKGLPQEILDRHSKFTKSYDDNLKELKANLDNIDKAKDKAEVEARVKETKDFLEKRKPPTKHVPLDPNNLPHRNRKGKEVKLEEIRQDSHPSIVDSRQSKPILVAANGPLTGLLSQDSEFLNSPRPYAGEGWGEGVLLAQATTPPASAQPQPTAADLAENGIEIVFTPAIKAKAEELGKNPVKIYNWVRNNIEYVPTYGSIQGADMCLQTKQCNDMDTASLLISLLRYSGIYSHYASATIELPISKGVNWVGRFTDQKAALDFMASGGIPVSAGVSGGRITSARIQQHFWVEAWIDMIPSQGAVHKQGDTWVPLDASYKQYTYTQGIDIKSAVPFDAESFINQIRSTASIDTANNSVTNVNSLYVQQQMKDYQTRVQNYISQNNPNATVGDVLGKKEIVAQNIPVFMGTLPYKTLTAGTKYSSVPDNLRHKITFSVTKDSYDSEEGTPINITKNLPELAGKKITLSSSPATSADEAVINSFLPKPHADGTPIQPSELPTQLPAYLINVKPELRVDGVVLASGTPVGLGTAETFAMSFSAPNRDTDRVTRIIGAGEYTGIAID
ncbi:MAG TPA: transglutaminase-like domain-containing protein, partial [Thermodesulfovibrionales bacterium]|nr:transglutaminase-like domain-containing protein [Thermodesulfovibrionales bacterium]